MNFTPEGLRPFYLRSVEYVEYLKDASLLSQGREVSEFWADILNDPSRKNYPGFEEMLRMRRGGSTSPMADPPEVSEAADRAAAEAVYQVFSRSVPATFLQRIPESELGEPRRFHLDGAFLSAGAVANGLSTYRIMEWIERLNLTSCRLRILEIGPGYGALAYQLCKLADVESYTLVDLPENLFLSSFYLPANFPEKTALFVRNEDVAPVLPDSFRFLVPSLIDRIQDEFDLVINTYSFQEMPLDSVRRYFQFASEHLSEKGFLYSLNAHGKSGITRPSDYDTEKFCWEGLAPVRRAPHHVFLATTPYEVVLSKRVGSDAVHSPRHFDALGQLIQLGLFDDVTKLCTSFVRAILTVEERAWLDGAAYFFSVPNLARKRELLAEMTGLGVLPEVVLYLDGLLRFAAGDISGADERLRAVLPHFTDSFVDARISLILATCRRRQRREWAERAAAAAPHLAGEIEGYSGRRSAIRAHVAGEVNVPVRRPFIRPILERLLGR